MNLLILDGIFEGHLYVNKDAPPIWRIARRQNIHINLSTFEPTPHEDEKEVIEYKKAFVSLDGEMALYTLNGEHYAMTNSRDWVQPKNMGWVKRHEIVIHGGEDINKHKEIK